MSGSLPPPILNKRQNFDLWQSGVFGNKLRAWKNVGAWVASGFQGLVVLRSLGKGGGPCDYNLTPEQAKERIHQWIVDKRVPHMTHIMVNEAAPDQEVILQGEYLNDIHAGESSSWGYFFFSKQCNHMRIALSASGQHAEGLTTKMLLQSAMTTTSYENWQSLLGRYPGHVFEVSIYSRCLGDIPRNNTLIWEIRQY